MGDRENGARQEGQFKSLALSDQMVACIARHGSEKRRAGWRKVGAAVQSEQTICLVLRRRRSNEARARALRRVQAVQREAGPEVRGVIYDRREKVSHRVYTR